MTAPGVSTTVGPLPGDRGKPWPCASCGEPTVRSFRLCDGCNQAQGVAERLAQGLPAKVTDPATKARLGRLVGRLARRRVS